MAFHGRGNSPSINFNNENNEQNNHMNNEEHGHHHHYIHYWYTRRMYYPYDNSYFVIATIVSLLFILFVIAIYIFSYKPTIADPIESLKKTYINSELISILATIGLIGIINFFSKNKEKLIIRLGIIAVLTFILIIIFGMIKINFDATYDEEKFAELYELNNQIGTMDFFTDKKVRVSLNGIQLLDEKEAYIEENIEAYNYFKIKTLLCIILHIFVLIFNIYLIIRISTVQGRKNKINKDDLILYDKEENVKY